ncbi:MAG: hypothetical protein LBB40_01715 [Holophagales bacterium]|jgi:hypothetical protein|nr:hypothetical protein [Holophagales bacterium]
MNTVEILSLAHIRFLSQMPRLSRAPGTEAPPDDLTFEGLVGLIMSYNEILRSKGEGANLAEIGLETLPFLLAQSSLTPYILIAATTDAVSLAKYLKTPHSSETQNAIAEATDTAMSMSVPELLELVLNFFAKFAPWSMSIRDYLSRSGASLAEPVTN